MRKKDYGLVAMLAIFAASVIPYLNAEPIPPGMFYRLGVGVLVLIPIYWLWNEMDKTERKDSE